MSNRVKVENVQAIVAYFEKRGITVHYEPVSNFSLWGGCTDEDHCTQHPAKYAPDKWRQIVGINGAELHSALKALGLLY